MKKRTDAILALLTVNAIFFAVTYFIPGMDTRMFRWFALYFPENENFEWWQLISNMFMHGNFMHILFNMYALWAFGSPLELRWGRIRFLLFYFLSGIGAGVIYTFVNYYQFNNIYNELAGADFSTTELSKILTGPRELLLFPASHRDTLLQLYDLYNAPAVGASGAIYGVLVAFGMMFPNAKLALIFLPVPIAARYFIPILIGLDLFSGITGVSIFGGGIAHFAHIGGAVIGFLLMWYWRSTTTSQS